jgi:hypothetical protein
MAYVLKEKFGVDGELFEAGTVAVKVKSPYPGDIKENPETGRPEVIKEYFVRSTYGGFDLYDDEGNNQGHIKNGTGNCYRLLANLYDEVEDD